MTPLGESRYNLINPNIGTNLGELEGMVSQKSKTQHLLDILIVYHHARNLPIGRVSNVTLCPQVSNISFMFINFR